MHVSLSERGLPAAVLSSPTISSSGKLSACSLARKGGSMALLSEFLNVIIFFVTRPVFVLVYTCLFFGKIFIVVVHTWLELLKNSITVHLNIFWTTLMWIITFISLPGRVLAALQRERQLQQDLQFLESKLKYVLWERKELQKHFQAVIKEQKMMELMLEELEMIHEKATAKIALLESELQNLKDENLRPQENKGKRSHKPGKVDDNVPSDGGLSSCSSNFSRSCAVQSPIRGESGSKLSGLNHTEISSNDEDDTKIVDEQRDLAVSRSLFSTILSLLVGTIIWEAEEPQLCLIMALLTVVSISLKSVITFLARIKNKPALDAVALLSFNWFVLGMLACPTLPNIARLLAPLISRFLVGALQWFGLSIA